MRIWACAGQFDLHDDHGMSSPRLTLVLADTHDEAERAAQESFAASGMGHSNPKEWDTTVLDITDAALSFAAIKEGE